MAKILMPIKPEYANKILLGQKKYEYRKIKSKRKNIEAIIIYSTHPIMKVIGEVEVVDIIEGNPDILWKKTQKESGVNKIFYDHYYSKKSKAVAYKLGKVKTYESPLTLNEIGIDYYPQSFVYID